MEDNKVVGITLQNKVETLPELFHLLESIYDSGKDLTKYLPKGSTAFTYIDILDDLVNVKKDHLEYDAILAMISFQYIDLDRIEDQSYVDLLNEFMIKKADEFEKELPKEEFNAVRKLSLIMRAKIRETL